MRRKQEHRSPPPRAELVRRYDECLRLNDGRLILEGVCARSGVVTHNGRVYPAAALERAARAFQRGAVASGAALGELDHPSYGSSLYRAVSLANASHAVLGLAWRRTRRRGGRQGGQEGELVALVEVLPTPSGLLLFALAARGVPIACSQRCWAEVEWRRVEGERADGGTRQVGYVCGRTLELLAIDAVPDPANAGAWLSPVVTRRVCDGRGGGCWPLPSGPAVAAVDPSAVPLAHLGTGTVSPAVAAEGGLALPTAARVVDALRAGAADEEPTITAAAAAAPRRRRPAPCVGPLQLGSHYADACLDEAPEELRALVAAWVEQPTGGGGSGARSLPAHWRRFAERALRCEAQERARARRLDEEKEEGDEDDDDGHQAGCLPCLPALSASSRRGQQRGRRRAGGPRPLASVAPLRSPLVGANDEEGGPAAAAAPDDNNGEDTAANAAALEAEVDVLLWSRADKARDVRRRVLRRWLLPPP